VPIHHLFISDFAFDLANKLCKLDLNCGGKGENRTERALNSKL